MTAPENYNELADKLTGDQPVSGVGKALYGEEAAAYGRRMVANGISVEQLVELPSDFAVLIAELVNENPSALHQGAGDKTVISRSESK